jgi:hypothetical protein
VDDQDYAGLLKTLEDTPDSPSEVSIERAVRTGRRTVLRRRAAGAFAVLAVIAGASITPPVLDHGREPAPAETPSKPAPDSDGYSIWSQEFEAGTAGGFTPAAYQTGQLWQRIIMKPASDEVGKDAGAVVTMWMPDTEPDPAGGEQIGEIAGGPVYLAEQTATSVILVWRYAAPYGRVASGVVRVTSTADNRIERAKNIAEAVHRRTVARPVSVPFTVAKSALGDRQLTGVWSTLGSGPQQHRLVLGPSNPDGRMPDPPLSVGVTLPAPTIRQTTTIGGNPAAVSEFSVTIVNQAGNYGAVATASPVSSYRLDLSKLAGSVRMVANPDLPTSWTTKPIR